MIIFFYTSIKALFNYLLLQTIAAMKPAKVYLFILLCLASLVITQKISKAVLASAGADFELLPDFQKNIIPKPDSTAYFAKLKEIEKQEVEKKREEIKRKVKLSTADTLALLKLETKESEAKFYFPNDDAEIMDQFFEALNKAKADKSLFRIIHYGDSQIEMDRISSYLREQLQKTYGGSGMGLLPAMEVTPKYTVDIQSTGTWERKLTFGSADFRAKHNRYGPMAYFCKKGSDPAGVYITARKNSSFKNRSFNYCKVLIGPIKEPIEIALTLNGKNKTTQTLEPSEIEQVAKFDADSCDGKVHLSFKGANADVLGISLENKGGGIVLDNIPMRGGSGTVFRKINKETLKRTYKMLGVKMVILQFGGNALPGMSSKSSADAYGRKFYEEIKYLKSIDSSLMVFVIGPADMSIRENGNLVTHPQLENVRDALKSATLRAGGVFWDMYEAMGGNGSMVRWVQSKPKLGSPDYIHFTPKGAEKIAGLFYQTLLKELEMYRLRKNLAN